MRQAVEKGILLFGELLRREEERMATDADKFVGSEVGNHGSSYLMISIFLNK